MEGISVKTKDIVCAVICMDQRLLIAKRSSGVHENIWEFPGGKVEPEETREQAVAREIREELELCVDIDRYLTTIQDNREDCTLLVHCLLYTSLGLAGRSLGDFGYYCSEFHHGCFKVDKDAVGGYVEYLAW